MKKTKFLILFISIFLQTILLAKSNDELSFMKDIKPILDNRCVVCHSCYNSPCQLKLSSFEGILRGATGEKIYDNRIEPAKPSRLFIDASTQEEWQDLGFHSVLKKQNQESIMSRVLKQKQKRPENIGSYAPETDELQCSKDLDELNKYLKEKPNHGMPYGFPALEKKEHELLISWLNGKIKKDKNKKSKESVLIKEFEEFFNNPDLKHQVSARYIYEHLFLAHIKFPKDDSFYSLVRTYNKDGSSPVKTRTPYGKPKQKFYYKFKKIESTIVHKTHMVYKLDKQKLQRYKELFINTYWDEKPYMPSYKPAIASNPLIAFKQIPKKTRYEFMLDNVHYFIMTFIRGPVCKGQVALNVINDHFWVAFKNPNYDYTIKDKNFLDENQENLSLPNEYGGNSDILDVFSIYKYNNVTIDYYKNKNKLYKKYANHLDFNTIWKGNNYGKNNNDAILTIYRHFDSSSVHKGALGDIPKTMWMIDYPLLERLYYSLVAGFDVYGNTQHKVLVRKYMDRLRIEGESNFLEYLPKEKRKEIFNSWYKGALAKHLVTYTPSNSDATLNYDYKEFITRLLSYTKTKKDEINFIDKKIDNYEDIKEFKTKEQIQEALKALSFNNQIKRFKKFSSNNFNLAYIRFKMKEKDLVYTAVINRWHDSVAFLFNEESRLDVKKDKINFIEGFIGSYPNYFVVVEEDDIKEFFDLLKGKVDESKLSKFFINRNHKDFWQIYDWFQNEFYKTNGIKAGLFDLNRYYKKALEEGETNE
ncbi:fatty acid cis/trans isomerase [Arcobacter roscoffensis]|uniref:Fatty acid cis/trans isomerase n=1 Tax=Arcobacter roscoffensis TaxID=2961520 RepID=A0ABY5E3X1_9BACT|nr:fatty acid cis/trans isomerase [Arcobacter roscoffensis]UTJ06435.1 fatty acid cis/trans isomerase [Arcobacter roscoffensis]